MKILELHLTREYFLTFWKADCCTKFLFIELEVSVSIFLQSKNFQLIGKIANLKSNPYQMLRIVFHSGENYTVKITFNLSTN